MKSYKKLVVFVLSLIFNMGMVTASFAKGTLTVKTVARNAVRIQYAEGENNNLPDWVYVKHEEVNADIRVDVDKKRQRVVVKDKKGKTVFTALRHELVNGEATLVIASPKDECLYGLGQFQDGYSNIRGLTRRLTQVNTQISVPMMLSSKGYGLLWNNYGLTDFNPSNQCVALTKQEGEGNREVVNVTSTEGTRREVRQRNVFQATINVKKEGDYSLLLDVGQKMARRHHLQIDGETVIDLQNTWLPPTASAIVHLKKGKHTLYAELSRGDEPVVYYGKVKDETVFHSPKATAVDYTIFVGTADEIIASYRDLTGHAPLMPRWATGYIPSS